MWSCSSWCTWLCVVIIRHERTSAVQRLAAMDHTRTLLDYIERAYRLGWFTISLVAMSDSKPQTHIQTHTYTQTQRETERERGRQTERQTAVSHQSIRAYFWHRPFIVTSIIIPLLLISIVAKTTSNVPCRCLFKTETRAVRVFQSF